MLSIVLGLFLLGAAGLKIHGLYVDPYSQETILLTPRLLVAVIELEILLGLWLLSGLALAGAWLSALVFFAAGAAANLFLAIEGQQSCGCFGKVTVSPWWTLGLDAGVVMLLLIIRPAVRISTAALYSFSTGLKTALSAGLVLVLIGGGFVLLVEDPARALAQLRGEAIIVEPEVTDVGEGIPGKRRTFTIRVRNLSHRTVRIFGGTTSCACIATKDLPLDVPPYESRSVRIEIGFRGPPGRFVYPFVLFAEDRGQFVRVLARYAGRVQPVPSP